MEDGIYKIGCSKDIENRIKQFNSDSLRLQPVEVLFTKEFYHPLYAEGLIHESLKKYRITNNREFFKVDLEIIKKVINETINLPYFDNSDPDSIINWALTITEIALDKLDLYSTQVERMLTNQKLLLNQHEEIIELAKSQQDTIEHLSKQINNNKKNK